MASKMMNLKERLASLTGDEAKQLLTNLADSLPEAGRLLATMLDPQPSEFFASVENLKRLMSKRRGISESQFESELESLQRIARLLPVTHQPEAGLVLVELGTQGYEFSHLLDSENAAAIDEGLVLYAESSLALGRGEEALAKLRELEKTDNYGLNAQEAIGLLTKASR